MFRRVGHGMKLHAADQRADWLCTRGYLIQAGLPAGPMKLTHNHPRVELDKIGLLLSAIDNSRHLACTPSSPRRPLTASRAYLGLDCNNVGHSMLLSENAGLQGCRRAG